MKSKVRKWHKKIRRNRQMNICFIMCQMGIIYIRILLSSPEKLVSIIVSIIVPIIRLGYVAFSIFAYSYSICQLLQILKRRYADVPCSASASARRNDYMCSYAVVSSASIPDSSHSQKQSCHKADMTAPWRKRWNNAQYFELNEPPSQSAFDGDRSSYPPQSTKSRPRGDQDDVVKGREVSSTGLPNGSVLTTLGKPTVKGRLHKMPIFSTISSLICLALAIATVANENLSWRLGVQNHQLIVLGFL